MRIKFEEVLAKCLRSMRMETRTVKQCHGMPITVSCQDLGDPVLLICSHVTGVTNDESMTALRDDVSIQHFATPERNLTILRQNY